MLSSPLVRRARIAAAIVLASATLTAADCGGDDDDPDLTVVGVYSLSGVATAAAPAIFANPSGQTFVCATGQTCEFQSGSITLNSNNTFSLSVQGLQRATGAAAGSGTQVSFVTSAQATGTWAQSGSTITFTPTVSAAGTLTGTLSSDNARMTIPVTLTGNSSYVLRFEQN